jgi:hypothetical protein
MQEKVRRIGWVEAEMGAAAFENPVEPGEEESPALPGVGRGIGDQQAEMGAAAAEAAESGVSQRRGTCRGFMRSDESPVIGAWYEIDLRPGETAEGEEESFLRWMESEFQQRPGSIKPEGNSQG